MTFDTTDPRDAHQETDIGQETTDAPDRSLSATGQQRMMYGDDSTALEQRLEKVRAETEVHEAAEKARLEQEAQKHSQMKAEEAEAAKPDASPAPPPGHRPQVSTTERGNEVKIEEGAEKTEAKDFHDRSEKEREEDFHISREGRLY